MLGPAGGFNGSVNSFFFSFHFLLSFPFELADDLDAEQVFYRVFRVNPNPNPNFRVSEMSGINFSKRISGSTFENPNF